MDNAQDDAMVNVREGGTDNPPEPELATVSFEPSGDPLTDIEAELDVIAGLDPAESVELLADLTARLNHEIEVDQEQS